MREAYDASMNYDRSHVPTIATFDDLKSDLLSKVEEDEVLTLPEIKLIEKGKSEHNTIVLTSYSRSGNTMIRAYIEKIMGLATGSDGNIQTKMIQDLLKGFVGEGL